MAEDNSSELDGCFLEAADLDQLYRERKREKQKRNRDETEMNSCIYIHMNSCIDENSCIEDPYDGYGRTRSNTCLNLDDVEQQRTSMADGATSYPTFRAKKTWVIRFYDCFVGCVGPSTSMGKC